MRSTDAVSAGDRELSIERPAIYVVATPIGNLDDMTFRGVATLRAVDRILAEDTRHSRRLLDYYGIATPCLSLHQHNEKKITEKLLAQILEQALAVAVISDAGTPVISDPGEHFIATAFELGIPVRAVPGACALTAAISVVGLSGAFVFEGFLPSRRAAANKRLGALVAEPRPIIIFEAPHRIKQTLSLIEQNFGFKRRVAIARELTKRFETVYRGAVGELIERLANDDGANKGELVLIIDGAEKQPYDEDELRQLLTVLLKHVNKRDALVIARELSGAKRNELYRLLNGLSES
ncbi:MAG: 16S rRNA (cytidine(1402)-2'-O)-methyltransferase [Pseudomonadota bacterium]